MSSVHDVRTGRAWTSDASPVNGLVFEIRELLDAALERRDRPLRGVNAIFDGVDGKRLEQPRFM